MDHNITKTGIWTGGPWEGFDVAALQKGNLQINPNLLPGSHIDANTSYTYPSSSYSDINIASIYTDVLNGTTYTVSFEAKSTVNGDKIRIHFYSPSNITKVIGSQGQVGTATDGLCNFTLTTNWEKYWVTYTIPANGNSARRVIIARLVSGQGTRNPKDKRIKRILTKESYKSRRGK